MPTVFDGPLLPAFIAGRPTTRYIGPQAERPAGRTKDLRYSRQATGAISDRVMFKATPSSPESPFALGRVWLLRLADGYKAWEGWSDAGGNYTATGLELGVAYIAVGIDPYRNHKATGAGPVVATDAAP